MQSVILPVCQPYIDIRSAHVLHMYDIRYYVRYYAYITYDIIILYNLNVWHSSGTYMCHHSSGVLLQSPALLHSWASSRALPFACCFRTIIAFCLLLRHRYKCATCSHSYCSGAAVAPKGIKGHLPVEPVARSRLVVNFDIIS
jgi:hypothetical protein